MDAWNENLRKQLAVAVTSIQWSYSIFWVLEWGEGYYNGDIKTRKTMEAVEFDVDQMSLKRSEQLRELYESLLAAQSKRPSAALIPEDLSHTEWYYLVCMSFVFNLGQGLPGRALRNGKPIWLSNAHMTDSRLFNRSILAKSASVQVLEDPSLIQYIEASLLESDYLALSQLPSSSIPDDFDIILDNEIMPTAQSEDEDDEVSHCISVSDTEGSCCHYQNILGSIFKSKYELIWEPWLGNKVSCFVKWKREDFPSYHNPTYGQKILKKILLRNNGGSDTCNEVVTSINTSMKGEDASGSEVDVEVDKYSISIRLIEKDDVAIQIRCPHKQYVLLDIMNGLTSLRLDTHSVQSSISHGFLSLTIKAKMHCSSGLSEGMIRQVLQKDWCFVKSCIISSDNDIISLLGWVPLNNLSCSKMKRQIYRRHGAVYLIVNLG
ncbi:uncharacterized protein, partial [Phyllobates terribilis]|uniref:uncharacterized protein n=1 Tax=Phyllobates terribilis TaxID=111132 RepID=UPI003CCA74DF